MAVSVAEQGRRCTQPTKPTQDSPHTPPRTLRAAKAQVLLTQLQFLGGPHVWARHTQARTTQAKFPLADRTPPSSPAPCSGPPACVSAPPASLAPPRPVWVGGHTWQERPWVRAREGRETRETMPTSTLARVARTRKHPGSVVPVPACPAPRPGCSACPWAVERRWETVGKRKDCQCP